MSTRKKSPVVPKAPAASRPSGTPVEKIGLEEIKGLIALVARESFAEFEFEAGGMSFRIRKDGPVTLMAPAAAPVVLGSPVAHVAAQTAPAPVAAAPAAAPAAPA